MKNTRLLDSLCHHRAGMGFVTVPVLLLALSPQRKGDKGQVIPASAATCRVSASYRARRLLVVILYREGCLSLAPALLRDEETGVQEAKWQRSQGLALSPPLCRQQKQEGGVP